MSNNEHSIPLIPGWAIYLRTSSKDVQDPESSHGRQQDDIYKALVEPSGLDVLYVYRDVDSGLKTDRQGYQQMLYDARRGLFSHIGVANYDRFGRKGSQALTACDELRDLGIDLRFASHPTLSLKNNQATFLFFMFFGLAQHEVILTSARVSGGMREKNKNGGHSGLAPDGYLNIGVKRTRKNASHENGNNIARSIVLDPERAHIWREAWDLLLTDRYTLKEICIELHSRGYRLRSGRGFVYTDKFGEIAYATSKLSATFRNCTYAGWVRSKVNNHDFGDIRGNWAPIVSDEEYEQGLVILDKRIKSPMYRKKHFYLLQGIVLYLHKNDAGQDVLHPCNCTTVNPKRSGGGTSYYRIKTVMRVSCSVVDEQVNELIEQIRIQEEHLPLLRKMFNDRIKQQLPHNGTTSESLKQQIRAVQKQEAEITRQYVVLENISEETFNVMVAELRTQRVHLEQKLHDLSLKPTQIIANFDEALIMLNRLPELYARLGDKSRQELIRLVLSNVVIDRHGQIIHVELLPPFALINELCGQLKKTLNNKEDIILTCDGVPPNWHLSCSTQSPPMVLHQPSVEQIAEPSSLTDVFLACSFNQKHILKELLNRYAMKLDYKLKGADFGL
jgi:DNA invertase Pin-like site-specific DNA recombinase